MSDSQEPTAYFASLLAYGFTRESQKQYTIKNFTIEVSSIITYYFYEPEHPKLSDLIYISPQTINNACKHRYSNMQSKEYYHYISSNILLSINPFERLPIYGQPVIDEFYSNKLPSQAFKTRPHPYGLADVMYKKLQTTKSNQSVVIMGQSGSGKVSKSSIYVLNFVYVLNLWFWETLNLMYFICT